MKWWAFIFLIFCLSGPSFAQSRQELRFQRPLRDLRRSLKHKNSETVVEELIKNANRTDLFELEALLRVYEDEYPETLEGFLKEDIKPFEDELGRTADLKEAIQFSEQVGAPPELIAFLKGREQEQKEKLKRFLEERGFIGEKPAQSPLNQLQEALEDTEWDGKKADRKHVLKKLRKLFKEVEATDYEMKELELGVHEFRRDLRWIPIYLRSFPDLFKLDPRKLWAEYNDPNHPVLKSPYSKLPIVRDKVAFPILFPQQGLFALNEIIDQLGKAKDIGKMEGLLPEALLASGAVTKSSEAKKLGRELVKHHPNYVPVFRNAAEIYKKVTNEETGLLAVLHPILKEQKKWDKSDCRNFLRTLGR